MSVARAEQVAAALLYEGYMLYPYRPSAVKNRQRFNFGVVYPDGTEMLRADGDGAPIQTECIVRGTTDTRVEIVLRFLHLSERTISDARMQPVPRLDVGARSYISWQEATEREVRVGGRTIGALANRCSVEFVYHAATDVEPIVDEGGRTVGAIMRRQPGVSGTVECVARRCSADAYALRVNVSNRTPAPSLSSRETLLLYSLVSVHTILSIAGGDGEFVSLTEPPDDLRNAAAACQNVRTWPVLVGEPGVRTTMLSSPIIVADYPEIAPESAGELFDGTEIDEILSLRILTLTEDEQREMAQADERARMLLERTRALSADQLQRLHGTMRSPRPTH